MNIFLRLAFLFFIGCLLGWGIELFYRRFKKANITKTWTNPGFLVGPYLPIYGVGLCCLYLIASHEGAAMVSQLNWGAKLVTFLVMVIVMTLVELISGLFFLNVFHIRLWDYSDRQFNYKGIICPTFSFFWALLGAFYYFAIHPWIINALDWFKDNLAFSFFVGAFFGCFVIDCIYSFNVVTAISNFAKEKEIVVKYEELRADILVSAEKKRSALRKLQSDLLPMPPEKHGLLNWFISFQSDIPLKEHLANYVDLRLAFDEEPKIIEVLEER